MPSRQVGSWVWLVHRSNYRGDTIKPVKITKVFVSCVECDGVKYNLREGDKRGNLRGDKYPTKYITLEDLQERYEAQVIEQTKQRLHQQIRNILQEVQPGINQLERAINILNGGVDG